MSLSISLLVTTLLCMAFATTRVFGIVGLFLLLNLYPVATAVTLTILGIAFLIYQLRKRS